MNAIRLLDECHYAGIVLSADGDNINYAGPDAALNRFLPLIAANKPDVLIELKKPSSQPHHLRLIQGKGIADDDAVALARKLARRDAQRDDRKSCIECRNFRPDGCKINKHPIGQTTMYTLHRAPCFDAAHFCEADHA